MNSTTLLNPANPERPFARCLHERVFCSFLLFFFAFFVLPFFFCLFFFFASSIIFVLFNNTQSFIHLVIQTFKLSSLHSTLSFPFLSHPVHPFHSLHLLFTHTPFPYPHPYTPINPPLAHQPQNTTMPPPPTSHLPVQPSRDIRSIKSRQNGGPLQTHSCPHSRVVHFVHLHIPCTTCRVHSPFVQRLPGWSVRKTRSYVSSMASNRRPSWAKSMRVPPVLLAAR